MTTIGGITGTHHSHIVENRRAAPHARTRGILEKQVRVDLREEGGRERYEHHRQAEEKAAMAGPAAAREWQFEERRSTDLIGCNRGLRLTTNSLCDERIEHQQTCSSVTVELIFAPTD